ncbi:hypothetical protein D3C78_1192740 [compost metagenome]
MREVVCVEHNDSIVLARHLPQLLQHPFNSVAFASQVRVRTNTCIHSMLTNNLRSAVRTVITNYENIVQLFRIIEVRQVLHQSAYNSLFVMRCYQHSEGFFRSKLLFALLPVHSKQRQSELVQSDDTKHNLQRYQNYVEHNFCCPLLTQSLCFVLFFFSKKTLSFLN